MKIKTKLISFFVVFALVPELVTSIILAITTKERSALLVGAGVGVAAAAVLIIIGCISAVKWSDHIKYVEESLNKFANGDFSLSAIPSSKLNGEIGEIRKHIDDTISRLKDYVTSVQSSSNNIGNIFKTLKSTSKQMTGAANEVSSSIQEVAKGASSQAEEIMEVVKLLSNFKNELDEVQNKISNVNSKTKDAHEKATYGKDQMDILMKSIDHIKENFGIVSTKVQNLSSTVSKIGSITDVINGISEQTNLLSLNASIEAARAGEAGRGFTVVAGEVRKLAEESKNSSQEIMQLVKSISTETEGVIQASDEVQTLLDKENQVAKNTYASFSAITGSVEEIEPYIKDTYSTMGNVLKERDTVIGKIETVSSAAEQVSASSQQISSSSEELLASTEEVSSLSEKTNGEVESLVKQINKFKVE